MNKLPVDTVRLLSSSQVVTSVSSAVKELVENALDAQATTIDVKLEKYGLDKIEVRDNGCGIKEADRSVMAQRFYTSKISKHEDLCQLNTYGFRGEALGSLCQVADVSIITKTDEDPVAVCYVLDYAGKITSKRHTHDGNGTTVIACNLFKNLPVRKQFYNNTKKCKEDLKNIEDILMAYGLMNPKVRISLKNNKMFIWQKNKCCDFRTAMMDVFGLQVCNQLDYFEYVDDETRLSLKCFLPKSDCDCQLTSRSTEDRCFIFINKRYVVWKELIQVLKKFCTWKSAESNSGRFPLCFVSLEIPAEDVDANLEPNKTRVLIKQKEDVLAKITQELCKLYEIENQAGHRASDCVEENPVSNDNRSNSTSNNKGTDTFNKTNTISKKTDVCNATCWSSGNTSDGKEVNHVEITSDNEDRTVTEDSPQTNPDNLNKENTCNNILDNSTSTGTNQTSGIVLEYSSFNNEGIIKSTLLQQNDKTVPDDPLQMNHVKNGCNKSEHLKSTPLDTSLPKQSEFDGVLNDLVDDLSVLDDNTFTIDSPLPNQHQWSKGHGLSDRTGKHIEPVNLLVPSVQLTTENETLKSSASSLIGKRKHSSLSNKDSSPRLSASSKRVKKVSKVDGQPLLTSVLQSSKTTKLTKTNKKSMAKQVSFSLRSLELASNQRQEALSSDKINLIKRLDPWGVWLISRKRELSILNPYRVQELLLYKRLMATHFIQREKLGNAIVLNERILGSASRCSILEKLVAEKNDPGKITYCSDERLVANGFEICGRSEAETNKIRIEIVKMNTTIPYFGVEDLIEILDLINQEEISHTQSTQLACCRPSKVSDFLKDEVVRVARNLPSRLTETDIASMLTKMKEELKDGDNTCIHNQPFFYPLTSY